MIGAIAGDVIGSVYEQFRIKRTDFPLFKLRSRFTDDTVLTTAVADAITSGKDYAKALREWARRFPLAGYGPRFTLWFLANGSKPYNSWGNGSAMRVSPVGFAFETLDEVLSESRRTAEVTHNHPEGIKGAQSVAAAVFLARSGKTKEDIRIFISERFGYDLNRTLDSIRPRYKFDVSCQGTVPEAIIAFLESNDYEDAVRKAVSLGGDSDTLACITGSIAHSFYGGVPTAVREEVRKRLPKSILDIMDAFETRYKLA